MCFACYYLRDKHTMSELFNDLTKFVTISARSHDLKNFIRIVSIGVVVKKQ